MWSVHWCVYVVSTLVRICGLYTGVYVWSVHWCVYVVSTLVRICGLYTGAYMWSVHWCVYVVSTLVCIYGQYTGVYICGLVTPSGHCGHMYIVYVGYDGLLEKYYVRGGHL